MNNKKKPHSNSSQFFITLDKDMGQLFDKKYVGFGKVVFGITDLVRNHKETKNENGEDIKWVFV